MTQNDPQAVYQTLLTHQQTMMMGTITENDKPLVSYTPFVTDADNKFYIYVSGLSQHTRNLTRTKQVSLMLIADEGQSPQIFARHRVTLSCQAECLSRESGDWQAAATLYDARFKTMFALLRDFTDFHMFRLTPKQGFLVIGFGEAYEMCGAKLDVFIHHRGN